MRVAAKGAERAVAMVEAMEEAMEVAMEVAKAAVRVVEERVVARVEARAVARVAEMAAETEAVTVEEERAVALEVVTEAREAIRRVAALLMDWSAVALQAVTEARQAHGEAIPRVVAQSMDCTARARERLRVSVAAHSLVRSKGLEKPPRHGEHLPWDDELSSQAMRTGKQESAGHANGRERSMLVEQQSRSMLNRVSSRCEMKDMHAVVSPALKIPQRSVGCFGVSELRLLGDPPLSLSPR